MFWWGFLHVASLQTYPYSHKTFRISSLILRDLDWSPIPWSCWIHKFIKSCFSILWEHRSKRGCLIFGQYCVKFSRRLQHLKQSYLLTYHRKVPDDLTKTIFGLLFRKVIHLPPTARTIDTSFLFIGMYVLLYAFHYPLYVHPSI